jgi:hypothetical protein
MEHNIRITTMEDSDKNTTNYSYIASRMTNPLHRGERLLSVLKPAVKRAHNTRGVTPSPNLFGEGWRKALLGIFWQCKVIGLISYHYASFACIFDNTKTLSFYHFFVYEEIKRMRAAIYDRGCFDLIKYVSTDIGMPYDAKVPLMAYVKGLYDEWLS